MDECALISSPACSSEQNLSSFSENRVENCRALPSRVTDEVYIYCYNTSTILSDANKTGKWLLYCDDKKLGSDGMTELDRAWLKAVELVETTELPIIRAKCSTAYEGVNKQRSTDNFGVIMFYTPDFMNKLEVRKVAEEINLRVCRKTISYKTDEASRRGMYGHHGKGCICSYRFELGQFYEAAQPKGWNIVKDPSISTPSSGEAAVPASGEDGGSIDKKAASCRDVSSERCNFKCTTEKISCGTSGEARVVPAFRQFECSDGNWRSERRPNFTMHTKKARSSNSDSAYRNTRCTKCNWREKCMCLKSEPICVKIVSGIYKDTRN